jgi:zinc transport system substrate-binding protein
MRRALGIVAVAALAAACQQSPPLSGKPLVVASFYPLYEFARQVAGDRADVVSLVPPGVEPHDWEPSPQSLVEVRSARLFVYNGAGFEPWADKLAREAAGGKGLVVDATKGLDLLSTGGRPDPHVWLDPMLARAQVDAVAEGLARVDPANAAAYRDRARAFAERLTRLDRVFAAGLRDCARRDVVTSHAAFAYLTRRYGLTQVPVMGLAPESEPSPAELGAIARLARERQVRYVFFETLVSPRLAEALAREVGAGTLVLNPVEGITREEAAAGKDYVALMEENLQSLRTGLGCR